jgi:hypothetical protein
MTYQLTLNISEGSRAALNIDAVAEAEHISKEAAAVRLLESVASPRPTMASPAALRILGGFSSPEDSAILEDAVEIAMEDRRRRNQAAPHD